MERRFLRVGMAVAVKPAGGHRRNRSNTRHRGVITGLTGAKPDQVKVRFEDTGTEAPVSIRRIAYPLPSGK